MYQNNNFSSNQNQNNQNGFHQQQQPGAGQSYQQQQPLTMHSKSKSKRPQQPGIGIMTPQFSPAFDNGNGGIGDGMGASAVGIDHYQQQNPQQADWNTNIPNNDWNAGPANSQTNQFSPNLSQPPSHAQGNNFPFHLSQSQQNNPTQKFAPQYQAPGMKPKVQGQVQGQTQKDFLSEFQSSATGQIGMQLGSQAYNQAQQQISSNMGRYFDIVQWRYYFNGWARIIEQTDDNGQVHSYAPPRADLNAPDLYIPVMSLVTYVIIVGVASGINTGIAGGATAAVGKAVVKPQFSPDVLGLTASSAFFLTCLSVFFIKMGNYFLNVIAEAPLLELFAYSGYKFIPICLVLIVKHFTGTAIKMAAFSYLFFAFGFFTIRTLRAIVIPEAGSGAMNDFSGSARKQRVVYLFVIAGLETFISWLLI